MVKESIFNLLDHSKKIHKKMEISSILDLFSGSGSFGLECLSRGSKFVYFFENYIGAIKILEKNAVHFDEMGVIEEKYITINEKTKVTIDELKSYNTNWLINYMSS